MSTFCEPCAPDCGEKELICFYLLLRRLSLGRLMYKTQGTVEKSRYTMKKSTVEKSTLEKNTSKVEKSMSTMEKRAHLLLSSAATALVWLQKTHRAYLPTILLRILSVGYYRLFAYYVLNQMWVHYFVYLCFVFVFFSRGSSYFFAKKTNPHSLFQICILLIL